MAIEQSSEDYFEEWHPYDQLIRQNYIRHREIIKWLKDCSIRDSVDSIRILELGCGNAYVVHDAFGHLKNVYYTGVDFSCQALKVAREKLKETSWETRLIEADIETVFQELECGFDLMIAGFSLHHFSKDSILNILQQTGSLLVDSGQIFIYDVVSRDNESRSNYNRRLIQGVGDYELDLNIQQLESIQHHIETYDFPIDFSRWEVLAKRAGFTQIDCVYRGAAEYYALMQISRPKSGGGE